MAEEEGSSWWSSWTTGILENVREKTSSAFEFVQSDLTEFVNTIQHDTSVVIADSATAVNKNIKIEESEKDATTGKLKQGFSDILTSISTSLHNTADKQPTISHNEDKTDEQRSSARPAIYDRSQAKLQEMQTNPETYCNEPDNDVYLSWCETFNLDSKKGEISELLVNNPDVRRLYTKFVPSTQSHSTFWHRYFYKVHEIETENKRLADIVARASRNDNQDWGWDDDDDDEDITTSVSSKDEEVRSIVDSKVTSNNELQNKDSKSSLDDQNLLKTSEETKQDSEKNNIKNDGNILNTNLEFTKENGMERNIVESDSGENDETDLSKVSSAETKSEGDSSSRKSDSSDSWIRILDKEGTSSNSSSSVVVVNDKELDNDDDDDGGDDDDNDDDDFDFNEDISNEDVEKLVQSITANELDSGEEDWEDWE